MRPTLTALTLAALLSAAPTLLDRAWALLSSLWSEEGCHIDPNGCPAPRTDTGCKIDPNGQCLPERSEEGCRIDPDGRCLAPREDSGCIIDPNGRCIS